jgi:hypothetical protein
MSSNAPPSSPPSGAAAVKTLMEEFDSIDAYLQAVHEILGEGHMPDIADLDNRVAHLCTGIANLDPDHQGRCLARLGALLKKLDECEQEITDFQSKLTVSVKQ